MVTLFDESNQDDLIFTDLVLLHESHKHVQTICACSAVV